MAYSSASRVEDVREESEKEETDWRRVQLLASGLSEDVVRQAVSPTNP